MLTKDVQRTIMYVERTKKEVERTVKNELLRKCQEERKRVNKSREHYNDDRMYKPYADGREKEITIKEKIIEILCGTEEMTPRTAEKILNDTKELIASTAMDQPINKKNDQ